MRMSPWLEQAVAHLLLSHPDQATSFPVAQFNAGQLYLDLCTAVANEIWDVGSFRGDQIVSSEAVFLYEVPPNDQEWPHLYLAQPAVFTPIGNFYPASWRVRWVEATPPQPPPDWVAAQHVLLAGPLKESGELRAGVLYSMQPSDFHLFFDQSTLYTARPPFCKWFFDTFLLQLATTDIYNERTYLFFKDTIWPPGGEDVPNFAGYPPAPPFALQLTSAAFDFDLQGGTLRNSASVVLPVPWVNQECNMIVIFRDLGDHGNYVNDWLYFFIGTLNTAFIWTAGTTPTFLPGELVINVA